MKRLSTKDKAQLINDYLLSKEEVIAYKHYESLLKDHPEIKEMEDELKAMQKELTRRKVRDEEISDLYEEYLTKKKAFEERKTFLLTEGTPFDIREGFRNFKASLSVSMPKKARKFVFLMPISQASSHMKPSVTP